MFIDNDMEHYPARDSMTSCHMCPGNEMKGQEIYDLAPYRKGATTILVLILTIKSTHNLNYGYVRHIKNRLSPQSDLVRGGESLVVERKINSTGGGDGA